MVTCAVHGDTSCPVSAWACSRSRTTPLPVLHRSRRQQQVASLPPSSCPGPPLSPAELPWVLRRIVSSPARVTYRTVSRHTPPPLVRCRVTRHTAPAPSSFTPSRERLPSFLLLDAVNRKPPLAIPHPRISISTTHTATAALSALHHPPTLAPARNHPPSPLRPPKHRLLLFSRARITQIPHGSSTTSYYLPLVCAHFTRALPPSSLGLLVHPWAISLLVLAGHFVSRVPAALSRVGPPSLHQRHLPSPSSPSLSLSFEPSGASTCPPNTGLAACPAHFCHLSASSSSPPPRQLRYPVPLTFSFSPTAVASSVFLARVFSYIAATALLALYILRLLGLRFEPSIPRFVPAASPLFNLPSHAHLSTQHPPSDSRPSTRQTAAPPLPTNPKRTSQLHHLPPLVIRCSSAVLHTLDSALQRVAGRRPSPRPS